MNRPSLAGLARLAFLCIGGFVAVETADFLSSFLTLGDGTGPMQVIAALVFVLAVTLVALGVVFPVPDDDPLSAMRPPAEIRAPVLAVLRAAIPLAGVGIGGAGVALLGAIPENPPGDGFAAGLAAGFGLLAVAGGVGVFAGGFAVPAPTETLAGRILAYTPRQRRAVGAGFGLVLVALVVGGVLSAVGLPVVGVSVPLALLVAYVVAVGVFCWRVGEAVVRAGRPATN